MRALALIGLVGCGRIGFPPNPAADASDPVGEHDEDGDRVPDVTDNCPHLPNEEQIDVDLDAVGDACDPEPTNANQRIALFAAMTPGETRLAIGPEWQQEPDALRFGGTGAASFAWSNPIANSDIWLGVDLRGIVPNPTQQLVIIANTQPPPYVSGEIFGQAISWVALGQHDGTSFIPLQMTTLVDGIRPGVLTMHLRTRLPPESFDLQVDWSGVPYGVAAVADMFAPAPGLSVSTHHIDLDVRYLAVIESP